MRTLLRLCRVLSLVILAVLGTCLSMYFAPGYFADAKEMDAVHAQVARAQMENLHAQQGSVGSLLRNELGPWLHGNLGDSRQFGTPVATLMRERIWSSGKLLFTSVLVGWSAALLLAIPLSMARHHGLDLVLAIATSVLLAVPVGALATLCLIANFESPMLVLALVIAVRDFRLLQRTLRSTWDAPHLLYARAQGLSTTQVLSVHVVSMLRRELLSMGVMSFTLALSALVPVEVIFDRPGLGQLAWSAAMNRDLPVLVAVTALVAAFVGMAGIFIEPNRKAVVSSCA